MTEVSAFSRRLLTIIRLAASCFLVWRTARKQEIDVVEAIADFHPAVQERVVHTLLLVDQLRNKE